VTDVRHILVLPDREAAQEIAERIARDLGDRGDDAAGGAAAAAGGGFGGAMGDRFVDGFDDGFDGGQGAGSGEESELQVVREALAGEDDAEDAQWLVVLQGPRERYDPERLDALADEYDGWLERS
jgi:hypothetical protein